MNKDKSEKNQLGSSPIIHPKKNAQSSANAEKMKNEVRHHLAHFGSSEVTPGGGTTQEQMLRHNITANTTGNRWYVSYYITGPTGDRERKRAYGRVNAEKDLAKRMKLIMQLQIEILQMLSSEQEGPKLTSSTNIYKSVEVLIAEKTRYLKNNSIKTTTHHLGEFKKWLLQTNNELKDPSEIKRKDILEYRSWLLNKGIANRTINNNMREVSSLFNFIIDSNENAFKSPLKGLAKLPSRSETHVAYTTDQFQKMLDYMKENDQCLLFFIKLIAFAYLRTEEAKMLRVKDIDLAARKILLSAKANKTNKRTYKIIQDIIVDEFEKRKLQQYPGHYFLFSKGGKPGPTPVGENYFRKRFKKVKKEFNLTKLHTVYGFRHTSVAQLLLGGTMWHDAMDLTGHEDMTSFQKYARSVIGRDPKDLSSVYTVKL